MEMVPFTEMIGLHTQVRLFMKLNQILVNTYLDALPQSNLKAGIQRMKNVELVYTKSNLNTFYTAESANWYLKKIERCCWKESTMKLSYKEHYPNHTDLLDASDNAQGRKALCGQPKAIVLNMHRDNDLDEEIICSKCRNKACPDCFGTGIMGGKSAGIYCSCNYGTVREFNNE